MDRHSEHVFDLQDSLSLGTGDYYFKASTWSSKHVFVDKLHVAQSYWKRVRWADTTNNSVMR